MHNLNADSNVLATIDENMENNDLALEDENISKIVTIFRKLFDNKNTFMQMYNSN